MGGNKNIRGSTEWEKKFIDNFNQLCNRHSSWQIWQDFVDMSACAIANAVDRKTEVWKTMEDSYMETVQRYSEEELELISELLSITTLALEENPEQDFLGELYMRFNLENKWHGQFFTPWHIAELMAKMLVGDDLKEKIASDGYISVNDPCCGAGCMLIAFANICKDELDVNYQKDVLFVGQDIDPVVAKMCYIQISLLGCPGYVVIGNSLTEPIGGTDTIPIVTNDNDIWYTPLWFTGFWPFRLSKAMSKKHSESDSSECDNDEDATKSPPEIHPHKPIANNFQKKKFSLLDFFTKR
ncbi:N-6 DNA methylase [uncultured Phocaeicola sp.]|uniref:N-6 DNA methylase n=1 Tax=uncultured Phocaeicola sp. TaxID=990718 RepID=UPI0025A064B3|nr:N-6 DNA methylase [uncultured Phocaeicola sp.]